MLVEAEALALDSLPEPPPFFLDEAEARGMTSGELNLGLGLYVVFCTAVIDLSFFPPTQHFKMI